MEIEKKNRLIRNEREQIKNWKKKRESDSKRLEKEEEEDRKLSSSWPS